MRSDSKASSSCTEGRFVGFCAEKEKARKRAAAAGPVPAAAPGVLPGMMPGMVPGMVPPAYGYGMPPAMVPPAAPEAPAPPNNLLFVENLPHDATKLMLSTLFNQ